MTKPKRSWTMTPKRKAYLERLRKAKQLGNQVAYQPDPTPEEIEERCAEFRKRHLELFLKGNPPNPDRPGGRPVSTQHLPLSVRREL